MINRIQPIPLDSLNDSVVHKHVTGLDSKQKATYRISNLSHVNIAQTKSFSKSTDKVVVNSLKMLYDMVNSYGLTDEFTVDDVIKFNGRDYLITDITPVTVVGGVLHHYVINLS